MKKARIQVFITILLLSLISCTSEPEQPQSTETTDTQITETSETENDDWWYISKDEWIGLETQEYPLYNAEYVSLHPNGSPDPQPEESDVAKVDLSRILFRTQKEQYSIRADVDIPFQISYSPSVQDDGPVVFYYHELNIEKMNGETWTRLIDRNFYVTHGTKYPKCVPLQSGQPFDGHFWMDGIITKPTPGKYRLVAYVNYQPVYAEFELTE